MLKQQKPWGVKRLLKNTFAKDENVTEDSDIDFLWLGFFSN